MAHNPKPSSSLALIAFVLIATTTSLCHATFPFFPPVVNTPPVVNIPLVLAQNTPPVVNIPPVLTPNTPPIVNIPPVLTPNTPPIVNIPPVLTPNTPPIVNIPPVLTPNTPPIVNIPPVLTPNTPPIVNIPPVGVPPVAPPPPVLPPSTSVTIVGTVACSLTLIPIIPRNPVNVTLSCDGGRTAVVPPVTTTTSGVFFITVNGTTATIIDPARCAVFTTTPVAGCPAVNPGQALGASLVTIGQLVNLTRLFVASLFSLVTRAPAPP